MFRKYRFSVAVEAVHVQQPEPIVEHVSCFCLFRNCAQMVVGLKWNHSRLFGDFSNSPGTDCWCAHLSCFSHSDQYRHDFHDFVSLPGSYSYDRNMTFSRIHRFILKLKMLGK